jgi:hypothetical protein
MIDKAWMRDDKVGSIYGVSDETAAALEEFPQFEYTVYVYTDGEDEDEINAPAIFVQWLCSGGIPCPS